MHHNPSALSRSGCLRLWVLVAEALPWCDWTHHPGLPAEVFFFGTAAGDRRFAPPALPVWLDFTDPRGAYSIRTLSRERFPDLADAPVVETRVCQYENTSTGDFLIDRHPDHQNVWFSGGGSGHGFKHGPAGGECMAKLLDGSIPAEPRFALSFKSQAHNRRVY